MIKQKVFLVIFCLGFLFLANNKVFAEVEGQTNVFYVEKNYDIQQREQVLATLVKISQQAYFYVDSFWYQNLTEQERGVVNQNLASLSESFDKEIYPKLTGFWGTEWKPGIDNDFRITIFFQEMVDGAAGYFNDGDEYSKQQSPKSNEREMVYLSAEYLKGSLIKSYLAHEFTHLISFNQKDRQRGVSEETWLSESRAEYSISYLGYDEVQKITNLQQRIKQFSQSPSDSLVSWLSKESDYGIITVFINYLAEKYGSDILVKSLASPKVGIDSLNEALQSKSASKDLFGIFSDWAVAVLLNDCSLGEAYCYKSQNLQGLRIAPSLVVLPSTGQTNLSLSYVLAPWSSAWYRFIGSEGDLNLSFNTDSLAVFNLPYVLCEKQGGCQIFSLNFSQSQEQKLIIQDFSQKYLSLTLVPSVKSRYGNMEATGFNFSVLIEAQNARSQEDLIAQLQAKIEILKAEIAKVQAKLASLGQKGNVCSLFQNNLYFGLKSEQVKCLQEFLKSQGEAVYPQGIVSGYFGILTKAAVIKFQEKYAIPSTGYVGALTRAKINQLL
ncbi:MAG: peptidoglycan-binding protein [Candidatus Pacebacteria bacterium]|nr:peptidoglycan-binding protein [Candidatus Paceibacterota bacterium]